MAEGRLRVTGEIVDINRAEAVDHFRLTGTLRDLFELQDDLAERIARKLSVALAPPADESQPAARAEAPPDVPLGGPLRVRPRPLDPTGSPRPPVGTPNGSATSPAGTTTATCRTGPYLTATPTPTPTTTTTTASATGVPPRFYRPYRPLYQHRVDDYTYRGMPDRSPYHAFGPRNLRSFDGPVPLHWYRGY
jgi:hypothetical protein